MRKLEEEKKQKLMSAIDTPLNAMAVSVPTQHHTSASTSGRPRPRAPASLRPRFSAAER